MEKNIKIDYLRLSVVDWCNLNCTYCTPLEKSQFLSHQDVLRYEEMVELAKIFIKAGIRKIRLTGGEPLVRRNIVELVGMLKDIEGLEDISMTTNGVLLDSYAVQLKKAGLDRVNISLDTLKRERFLDITGKDYFEQVYEGIKSALAVGFNPVKLNVILMKNVNDDEIVNFAKLTLEYSLVVRFIEFFHTNQRSEKLINSLMSSEKIKEKIISEFGKLEPVLGIKGSGPAQYYKLEDAIGTLGFIDGSTNNFCHDCNRIRLDCAGRISPCLFSGFIYDVRNLLRSNNQKEKLFKEIEQIILRKTQYTKETIKERKIEMSSLGG